MRGSRHRTPVIAILSILLLPLPCLAAPRFSAHLEAGFGASKASPLSESVLGVIAWTGVGVPARPGRITLDCAVSGAEGDESGDRALSTVLVGVEVINRLTGRGFFAAAGLGIGRATLSGAHSGPMGANPFRRVPNRDETGFAFGLGLGVRSYNGPGPLGLQMALRFHGLAAGGRVAASATMFTLGLTY